MICFVANAKMMKETNTEILWNTVIYDVDTNDCTKENKNKIESMEKDELIQLKLRLNKTKHVFF